MTDLTDRMRTCAAFMLSKDLKGEGDLSHAFRDAADLLIEASNVIEATTPSMKNTPQNEQQWGVADANNLASILAVQRETRTRSPRACPKCDSRANKRVDRVGSKLMLTCPVCGEKWEWRNG
jgi:hypothetical protein